MQKKVNGKCLEKTDQFGDNNGSFSCRWKKMLALWGNT